MIIRFEFKGLSIRVTIIMVSNNLPDLTPNVTPKFNYSLQLLTLIPNTNFKLEHYSP